MIRSRGCYGRTRDDDDSADRNGNADQAMKLKHRALVEAVVALLGLMGYAPAHAATVTITDSPGAFSADGPAGWSRQPAGGGDSRLKFVSPEGTPYAECVVIVKAVPSLRGQSQSDLSAAMREPPDAKAAAQRLARSYSNVRVVSVGNGALSGVPSQIHNVTYSAGTPVKTEWTRLVSASAATTPGIVWTVACGAQGRNLAEAEKAFDHWQLEIARFKAQVKFLR
jgi:hypothetical protein